MSNYEHLSASAKERLTTHFRACCTHSDVEMAGQDLELSSGEVYRLLKRLGISSSRQGMTEMFRLMDQNHNNTVSLDEFLCAINESISLNHVDEKKLRGDVGEKVGYGGTTWRHHGNIAWVTLGAVLIITGAILLHLLEKWRGVLAPLGMAYFLVLLLQPLMDLLEQRPLWLGPYLLCHHSTENIIDGGDPSCCPSRPHTAECFNASSPERLESRSGCKRAAIDFVQLLKVPHSVAVLVTLSTFFGAIYFVFQLTVAESIALLDNEDFQESFKAQVVRLREALAESDLYFVELDDLADIPANGSMDEGPTIQELSALVEHVNFVADLFAEIPFMLCMVVVMLFARQPRSAVDARRPSHLMSVSEQIESQIGSYITSKFGLSLATGVLTWVFLGIYQIELSLLFGILAFVLNFIPSLGSVIAIMLPFPVIICRGCIDGDDGTCLSTVDMIMAFSLPAAANLMIGNVVEPMVFGKALNLTIASVLFSLFFWTLMWGVSGAILSVPFLSLTKILLVEADYPWAKQMVNWIREDPNVDESREVAKAESNQDLLSTLAKTLSTTTRGSYELGASDSMEATTESRLAPEP